MSSSPRTGAWRRERLSRSRLYVVTGARQDRGDLAEFLDAVLAAGVDLIQLRERDAEVSDLLGWSAVFRAAADRHAALFIINDRPDLALAAGADGVHVGQDDLPAVWARRVIGADGLIGLSTHSAEQFGAVSAEVDYRCAGPVHETPTKPGRSATGLSLLTRAAEHTRATGDPRPWFAIGGIDARSLGDVVAAGAQRIVVVRAVTEAPDPAAAVRTLIDGLGQPG
ncbi:MAG: thiamine phosphate synthase [Candidatus Dormibacteria bacterium]